MNDLDIKQIRKKLGLSQKELAEKVEVHWRTVQNWEQGGEVPLSAYTKICALSEQKDTLKTQLYAGGEEFVIVSKSQYNEMIESYKKKMECKD